MLISTSVAMLLQRGKKRGNREVMYFFLLPKTNQCIASKIKHKKSNYLLIFGVRNRRRQNSSRVVVCTVSAARGLQ